MGTKVEGRDVGAVAYEQAWTKADYDQALANYWTQQGIDPSDVVLGAYAPSQDMGYQARQFWSGFAGAAEQVPGNLANDWNATAQYLDQRGPYGAIADGVINTVHGVVDGGKGIVNWITSPIPAQSLQSAMDSYALMSPSQAGALTFNTALGTATAYVGGEAVEWVGGRWVAASAAESAEGAANSEGAGTLAQGNGVGDAGRAVPNEAAVPNVVQLETRADYRVASLNPSPNTVYQYNGFEFTTDSFGRPVNSSGQLSLGNGGNRFYDDYKIGYPHNADALPGDVEFHAGGDQFGFPGGQLNIFPGNGELNSASGAYGAFERDVLKPLVADPNNTVHVQFQRIYYEGNYTTRPNEIQVIYQVNGQAPVTTTFLNQPGG